MELVAVAAPAAGPPVALTGAIILAAFAWVVLYGLLKSYDYSFGAFVRGLADRVEDIWIVGGKLADALRQFDSFVMRSLAEGIEELELTMGRLWDALAWVVRETGDAMAAFAEDVHAAIRNMHVADIPGQVDAKTRPLTDRLSRTNQAAAARDRAEAQARARGIDRVDRDLVREKLARERGIDRVQGRLDSVVLPRIRALDRTLDSVIGYTRGALSRRLSRVERLVLGGAIAAGALAVLTRYFPYWQCTNVRRFNRALCRAPIGALDDLLGLALLVVGSLSIVDFARALGEITEPITVAVNDWIVED